MENTSRYRLRFWTGPVDVEHIGGKAREAGLAVVCVGTEHIYLDVQGSDRTDAILKVRAAMRATHGTDFGMVKA